MGRLINEFLSTPIPSEVWHYTNLAGFEGILSSGRLWATEAHHTTDATEFVHARDVAIRYLERLRPKDDNMARATQTALETLVHAFEEGALSPSATEIFIASFCATDDLKSQWMEYGDAGCGVALAFDLRHVRPPVEIGSAVTFAPCLYTTDDKERLLEDALADWVNTVSGLHGKTGSKQWAAARLRDWQLVDRIFGLPFSKTELVASNEKEIHVQLHQSLTRTSFDLLRIASHCKDDDFYQEAEWRLALPHTKEKPMKGMEVLHRGANHAIPYVAHNLFADRLPLVRVKVGPMCESADKVGTLLKQYGFEIPIESSTIPIRPAASIEP